MSLPFAHQICRPSKPEAEVGLLGVKVKEFALLLFSLRIIKTDNSLRRKTQFLDRRNSVLGFLFHCNRVAFMQWQEKTDKF